MREHCLCEFNFHDPYLKQKQMENDHALGLLEERLASLKDLKMEALHEQLARGLLAGNVFDWGAKEVALLMESGQGTVAILRIVSPFKRQIFYKIWVILQISCRLS